MSTYAIADLHFGHEGILQHCARTRKFTTVDEMDAEYIRRCNRIVGPTDTLYILGDFCWPSKREICMKYFNALNGVKHLIIGNHDHKEVRKLPWASANYAQKVKFNGVSFFLCHYPVSGCREDVHLHGHEHGRGPFRGHHVFDVGIDVVNEPINFTSFQKRG